MLHLDYPDYQIVVVDNASTDGSLTHIENGFPHIRLLCNETNLGFGGGHNGAIAYAKRSEAEFIWLLNQDTVVPPDALSHLVSVLRQSTRTGAVSPLIYTPDQQLWFAGGCINWFRMRATHNTPNQIPKKPYQTEYLTGCAPLIRMATFQRLNAFDEGFFLYYEDADLSLRMRKAGYQILVTPTVSVWHAETSEKNPPRKAYWLVRSGLLFFRQHAPRYWQLWYTLFIPLRRLKNLIDIRFRPNPVNRAVHQAYHDWFSLTS